MDEPIVTVGIDVGATSTGVAVFVHEHGTLNPVLVEWGSGPPYGPAPGIDQFRKQLLRAWSDTFGLTIPQFTGGTADVDYFGPDMRRVKALIWRAAAAHSRGQRGWHRKLKRSKRIQREVCGMRISASWWHMQLRWAVDFYRRTEIQEFQRRVFDKFLADAVHDKLFTMPENAPFREELMRPFVPSGWRKRYLHSRPVLRFITDEVDAFKQPLFDPSARREVPPRIAHPEWYDEDGEFKGDDDE